MAILTMMELHGDSDELAVHDKETIEPIAKPLGEENGIISHTVLKTDDGIMIVNLWESEEGMEKVAAAVRPKAEAAGLPRPQNWRQYEILSHEALG